MDTIFLLTLGFIFLGALFSNILKWHNKDRVLKDLQRFHSTFEMQDGKRIWGKTRIYSNGMELMFSRDTRNSSGDPVTSYIFYNDDIDKIRAIYRNHSELSVTNQQRRKKEIQRVSNPGFFAIFYRKMRIIFNMFNDAIGEAFSVFLSRMKGGTIGNSLLNTQSEYLKKLGTTALSVMGNTHDPIMERYINRRVVVSLNDAIRKDEFCGFLKEYSSAWMSIVDCSITHTHHIALDDIERLTLQRDMDFSFFLYADDTLDGSDDQNQQQSQLALDIVITYFGIEPLKLLHIESDDQDNAKPKKYLQKINKTLKHGQSISLTLSHLPQQTFKHFDRDLLPLEFEMIAEERQQEEPEESQIYQSILPAFELEFISRHTVDIFVPRSRAVLRHSSE